MPRYIDPERNRAVFIICAALLAWIVFGVVMGIVSALMGWP
jgi:hypothetical protein